MPPLPNILTLLRLHRSTNGLTDEELDLIASRASVITFDADTPLHSQENPFLDLLLIISGAARLWIPGVNDVPHIVQVIGRSNQFGLLGLFHDDQSPVNVDTTQNLSGLAIKRQDAIELLNQIPRWHRNLLGALGMRLHQAFTPKRIGHRPRLVAILHASEEYRHLSTTLIRRLQSLGEDVAVISDREDTRVTAKRSISLLDQHGNLRNPNEVRSEASSWATIERCILDIRLDKNIEYLNEVLQDSDTILCCFDSNTSRETESLLSELSKCHPAARKKISLVRILRGTQQVADPLENMHSVCRGDFKIHWDGFGQSCHTTRKSGIERIIRNLRGSSIGFALGGGAARGMAHLGVLSVLDEEGIPIDFLSGTSAGALTGIPYAAGYDSTWLIETFSQDLKPSKRYKFLPYGDAWYMIGKFRGGGWGEMLRTHLFDWTLEQLSIPFTSVTADLVAAEQVHRASGDAANAILESINLPGVSPPICQNGRVLVDGGILNNVPADVLVNQGATFIVAVDVAAKIGHMFAGNNPTTPTDQMNTPNMFQTLGRVRAAQDRNIRKMGTQDTDFTIEPDVSAFQLTDFQNASAIAQQGVIATREALPQLRKLLKQLDPELFPYA
jgi:predicted acylesterase/phospholipase RssA/CRP-like cAMP-binding protein